MTSEGDCEAIEESIERRRVQDAEAQQYRAMHERALDQANRDAGVERTRAEARHLSAKAQVLEDLHAIFKEFLVGSVQDLLKGVDVGTLEFLEKLLKPDEDKEAS